MRNAIKIALIALASLSLVSCMENERSTATFYQTTSFEVSELDIQPYLIDSLMSSPTFTLDNIIVFRSTGTDINLGYMGGCKLSRREIWENAPDDLAMFTSASGYGSFLTHYYMAFNQSGVTPEYDVTYQLENFYSAKTLVSGTYIINSYYNRRQAERGLINPGDYLKVVADFYFNGVPVGSLEKYIIDYRTDKLVMSNEWDYWDMADEAEDSPVGVFDATKFRVEMRGDHLAPCFCIDDFTVLFDVTY